MRGKDIDSLKKQENDWTGIMAAPNQLNYQAHYATICSPLVCKRKMATKRKRRKRRPWGLVSGGEEDSVNEGGKNLATENELD